jgi:putative spermidine/putrescine transport system ATP-binding protein
MAGDYLELESLEKRFGSVAVTRGVSLSVARSEIVALLGPSGSGKTTVLRLIAGFETPDAGRIRVDGEDVTETAPERRRFGMVFQHYALFPHMTAGENVAFGLAAEGLSRAQIAERVAETFETVDLSGFENRRVTQLSGGQQQRIAVARALAPRPRVLLFDEPLSNLDPTLRERTRRELKRVIRRIGITTLFVTHEQEEAFDLGDRVAVLSAGRLEQVGTPEELYERPASRFVAGFVGRSSTLLATWRSGRAELAPGIFWEARAAAAFSDGQPVDLLVRPEELSLVEPAAAGALAGEILDRRFAGHGAFYTVQTAGAGEVEVLGAPGIGRAGDAIGIVPAAGAAPRAYPREATR